MIFYKTSSFGNDFIEIDLEELAVRATDKGVLAKRICDRQRGVGADGVVFYCPDREVGVPLGDRKQIQGAHFEIFNRDGSEAELSGNGMAGLAAVLFQRRLASSPVVLHAAGCKRRVELLSRRSPVFQLKVEIGRPDFSNRKFFPFLKDGQDRYVTDGLEFYPVSVGNPHAVVICLDVLSSEQLAILGKKLESHPLFPGRVNVEFVHGIENESCRVFFYERGVGPTLASATGSAAVFAVLRRLGKAGDRLAIDLEAAPAVEDPAGKEVGSHKAEYPAGAGNEKIAVSWQQGIFIHNATRLVCRGEYFF